MTDAKQISEAIRTYYKALTVWRCTVYQELETFKFQISNKAQPIEIMETVTRLNSALHYTNKHLDQLGELSFSLTKMLDK